MELGMKPHYTNKIVAEQKNVVNNALQAKTSIDAVLYQILQESRNQSRNVYKLLLQEHLLDLTFAVLSFAEDKTNPVNSVIETLYSIGCPGVKEKFPICLLKDLKMALAYKKSCAK
jgi:hypothetical protein